MSAIAAYNMAPDMSPLHGGIMDSWMRYAHQLVSHTLAHGMDWLEARMHRASNENIPERDTVDARSRGLTDRRLFFTSATAIKIAQAMLERLGLSRVKSYMELDLPEEPSVYAHRGTLMPLNG